MTDQQSITVIKRDGTREPLNIGKIHKMVEFACEDLAGVFISQVEMNSGIQFYDGISSADIQEILVTSAVNLITLKQPNYQYVAARLRLAGLVKSLFGGFVYPEFKDFIATNVKNGVYDPDFLNYYTEEEIDQLDSYIKHDRDQGYAYATLKQMCDKYLAQDRSSGEYYETPQFMYMMIAATLFNNTPRDERMKLVKGYYDRISQHEISLPTPILSGVRTPTRQFSSCVLIDIDDTLPSIFSSDYAVGMYTAQRAGIGLNFGRIRSVGSKIRSGEVEHTGLLPFMKKISATTRSCTQNGVRGGNATAHVPFWHSEIEDVIVLKNNKGEEANRIRTMDYSVQFSELFYQRVMAKQDITLFSPHDVPGLYDAFVSGDNVAFKALYEKYERATSIKKRKISAVEFMTDFLTEAYETARIYGMNIDHCNSHSSYLDPITMSNLCQEITGPTSPIDHVDDTKGEIALCTLSAINLGRVTSLDDLKELTYAAVYGLDELLDYQDYPMAASRHHAPKRRSLGIGYIGLAHYFARNKCKYNSPEAAQLIHETTEAFQYYLISASVDLAKKKGPCAYFHKTKYSKGILPIDTYRKAVDELVPDPTLKMDWESLRADVLKYGMRHSALSAQMPAESSAVVCNETNGIEPPRGYMSQKLSKMGLVKQIVPQYQTLKNSYDILWDQPSPAGYVAVVSIMTKFFDQAISGNLTYNPANYPDNKVPMGTLIQDFFAIYKYGWKTRYYMNSDDQNDDEMVTEEADADCDACVI